MIVGVSTTCLTQYLRQQNMYFFYLIEQHSKFLLHTLQVLYMCTLCDYTNINTIIEFVPNCLQHVSGNGFSDGSDSYLQFRDTCGKRRNINLILDVTPQKEITWLTTPTPNTPDLTVIRNRYQLNTTAYTYTHEIPTRFTTHFSTQRHYGSHILRFFPSCYSAEHHKR